MAESTFDTSVALEPSSTLVYLNNQLVTNGFVPSPGLALATLEGKDLERTIRCMLSLLSQRVDDMRRFETASTQLRTMTFEQERTEGMWREECEKSSKAERDMIQFKSKMGVAQKNLEEVQKKCQLTLVELTRTRSTLQNVRNASVMEARRKEKEVERLLERFQKLSGSGSGGGVKVVGNGAVEEILPVNVLSGVERKSLAEETLETTEAELTTLRSERERLHDVFVWMAREVCAMVADGTEVQPQTCISYPVDTLTPLLSALRTRLLAKKPDDAEYARLQGIISSLKNDVEHKEGLLKKLESHFAALRERSVVDVSGNELLAMERARLDMYRLELEEERQRINGSNLGLEEQRAAIEAERLALLEERQAWEKQQHMSIAIPRSISSGSNSTRSISPSEPILAAPLGFSASSPPRKKKPREFSVGGGGSSPSKSPGKQRRRERERRQFAPTPVIEESMTQTHIILDTPRASSLNSEEMPIPIPIVATPPDFSPLPSPPGALSLNGIGLEMSTTELDDGFDDEDDMTPLRRKSAQKSRRKERKPIPKHAYSPARPSPLSQQLLTMSVVSEVSEEEEENKADQNARGVEAVKSSFPAMPAGLAKKLGAIDNIGVSVSVAPKKTQAELKKSVGSGEVKSKSSKQQEKENKGNAGVVVGPAAIKVGATAGGARRVKVDAGSKGGWR